MCDRVDSLGVADEKTLGVTPLSLFGLFAVTLMLVAYAFEHRSPWFVLPFAAACALGSMYGFAQGAWPFGIVKEILLSTIDSFLRGCDRDALSRRPTVSAASEPGSRTGTGRD